MADDYENIENPYDALMNRSLSGTSPVVFDPTYTGMQDEQTSTGAVDSKPVATGDGLEDMWISTFIRSKNWKPGAQGFNIDGRTGDAEFNNVVVRGTIVSSAIIGGTITGVDFTGTTFTGATITGGTIQTAATGFRMVMDGAANSYKFLFNDLLLAELVSTAVPNSDSGGAALRSYGGEIQLATAYQASTAESILLESADGTKYIGIVYDLSDGVQIAAAGLPTSSAGLSTGTIWNDAGTLKIVL